MSASCVYFLVHTLDPFNHTPDRGSHVVYRDRFSFVRIFLCVKLNKRKIAPELFSHMKSEQCPESQVQSLQGLL